MTKPLRRAVDLSTVIAAVALVVILARHFSGEFRNEQQISSVKDSLRRFDQILAIRSASKDTAMTPKGWPTTIEVVWFDGDPPRNELVSPDRPWVEVAPPTEAHLKNPNVRIAADMRTASFWYNPYQGILRARVPFDISDEKARQLYNQVNGTSVNSIYGVEALLPEEQFTGPPSELASDTALPPATVSAPNE